MNAQCAKCGTQIRIDESKLGERGARIRCPTCSATVVVERRKGPAALDLDLEPTTVSADPRAVHDPTALDLSGAAAARAAGRPGARPAAGQAEPELVDDDDLLMVEADLVGDAGKGRGGAARPPRPPAPTEAHAETRVAPAPNLARPAAPPRSPAQPMAAESTVEGDPYMSGGLSADGTFEPPRSARPTAVAPPGVPAAAADEVELEEEVETRVAPRPTGDRRRTRGTGARPRSPLRAARTVVGTLLAAALPAVGILVFLGGGHVDARLLRLDRAELAGAWSPRSVVQLDGVRVTSMRSSLYPTRAGGQVLVLSGEVKNEAAAPRGDLVVVAELRDGTGRLVASERAPVGISLSAYELARADDASALGAAIAARPRVALEPGATAPFTVVLARPPPQPEKLRHEVSLVRAERPKVDRPAVVPAKAEPPAETAVEPDASPARGKLKGKGKLKAKSRPREAGDSAEP